MRDVSIIIVNYNTADLLCKCLCSIAEHLLEIDYEVIVVDNASADNSVELCENFKDNSRYIFIESEYNMGFSKANNIGAKHASSNLLHFLNPDTMFLVGMDSDYREILKDTTKVYVHKLRNPDGSIENIRKPLPSIKDIFNWNFNRKRSKYWCLGATVIISKEVFQTIGMWCEDYFLYAEDTELFYQLWKNNIPIVHLENEIFHYRGASSSASMTSLARERIVQRSTRIFFKRHYTLLEYILVKIYFLTIELIKRPKRFKISINAWLTMNK